MKKVQIFTDGACSGNPGQGGWGAILIFNGKERELSGYHPDTTNNKMELQAAIEALQCLKEPCEIELSSDSAYLINSFIKGWIDKWKMNGWINSSKEEVKNIEQWKALDGLNKVHHIS